jgi:aspartyl protease family protein
MKQPEENPSDSGGADRSEADASRRIGAWMYGLMWLLLLAGAVLLAQRWLDQRSIAREARILVDEYGKNALELRADRYGQYLVTGSANGKEVSFLVDTGASGISIPADIASDLGLESGRSFEVITANGTTTVYQTELASLSIGPFVMKNITAHINPAMQGDFALLGMSFLRHYQLVQRDGHLTISLP